MTATQPETLTAPNTVNVRQWLAVTPRHFRRDAAFVDEDELRRVDVPRFCLSELALRLDSFAVLLGGAE